MPPYSARYSHLVNSPRAARLRVCVSLALAGFVSFLKGAEVPSEIPVIQEGVLVWPSSKEEVAIFGGNYSLPSGSEFRAARAVKADMKQVVEQDFAHFVRMGWTGVRLSFWGDWECSDKKGNLVVNEHLDVLDYVIAEAGKRGITVLLTPITTYSPAWPDGKDEDSLPGFSKFYSRDRLCIDPKAIKASCNYLSQLLRHRNPYTGRALKDEPSIRFIEMINEPWNHGEDRQVMTRYLTDIAEAVRSTGCDKLLFHNTGQDVKVFTALQDSPIQGLTFGWYPTGLVSGHQLSRNYLRTVDAFPGLIAPGMERYPKLVYEFDSADMLSGGMYPAIARDFRAIGVQFAAMFTYDMLATAPYNLAWQTHYLNMVYTPKKAAGSIIAAEVMKRIPRNQAVGRYPDNLRFGPFRLDPSHDLAEMVTHTELIHTGDTDTKPPEPEALERVVGVGSSRVVRYEGSGLYFIEKVKPGIWRLELYPDAVPLRDPFEKLGSVDSLVTALVHREWPMTLTMPDLGSRFHVTPLNAGNNHRTDAAEGRFAARPGVYLLTRDAAPDLASLPEKVHGALLREFICPAPQATGPFVVPHTPAALAKGEDLRFSVEVVSDVAPEKVFCVFGRGSDKQPKLVELSRKRQYLYEAVVPAKELPDYLVEYKIRVKTAAGLLKFPEGFSPAWRIRLGMPGEVFSPADFRRCHFTRLNDEKLYGEFRRVDKDSGAPEHVQFSFPVGGYNPFGDFSVSIDVKDRLIPATASAAALEVEIQGEHAGQEIELSLVEADGTGWKAKLVLRAGWQQVRIPLKDLRPTRSALLPVGYPGDNNYWAELPANRGHEGDSLHIDQIEQVQLSQKRENFVEPRGQKESFGLASLRLVP